VRFVLILLGFVPIVLAVIYLAQSLEEKKASRGNRKTSPNANSGAAGSPDTAAAARAEFAALAARIGTGPIAGEDPSPGASAGLTGEAPDLIEPILAWRCWTIDARGNLGALNAGNSATRSKLWPPRETPAAVCNGPGHERLPATPTSIDVMIEHKRLMDTGMDATVAAQQAWNNAQPPSSPREVVPVEGCRCGFYAALRLEDAQWPSGLYAYGIVALWGKVIEHEGGYRAQYAYPACVGVVCLDGSASTKAAANDISRLYGIGAFPSNATEFKKWLAYSTPTPEPTLPVPAPIQAIRKTLGS
jgi:hypothetical protein